MLLLLKWLKVRELAVILTFGVVISYKVPISWVILCVSDSCRKNFNELESDK